jgi:transcriptional regulator with XRE-family HTH domain
MRDRFGRGHEVATGPRRAWSVFRALQAAQCRAARGLIDWSQRQLAEAAGVGVATIRLFEAGKGEQRRSTLTVIKNAFEAAGVEFTNGNQPGVRLRQ